MLNKIQVQIVLGLAVVVWAVLLFVEGVHLKASYLKPYSVVVTVVVVGLILFDRWLWRIPGISRLVRRPVLKGTWKGQLRSTWKDSSTGQTIEPIDVFLSVRQTFSAISLRVMTSESISKSLVASLDAPKDDVATISSTYQNVPRLLVRDRSSIHHGALMLEVTGQPARQLQGCYWTDRDTKGELAMNEHTKKLCTTFDEAAALVWSSS